MRLRNAGSKEGKEEPRLDSDGGRSSKTLCRLHPPHFSNFIENKDTANLHLSATQPDSVWVYLYSFAAAKSQHTNLAKRESSLLILIASITRFS